MMSQSTHRVADREELEARLGLRLGVVLREGAATVPHDIGERLRVAREQAVARARVRAKAASNVAAGHVGINGGAAVFSGGPTPWWLRFATWLPLVVLVSGLVAIEEWTTREQLLAAAEIDAVLLADELPPDAWADPGFREYLKSPPK